MKNAISPYRNNSHKTSERAQEEEKQNKKEYGNNSEKREKIHTHTNGLPHFRAALTHTHTRRQQQHSRGQIR
jgi:hypothetical protein